LKLASLYSGGKDSNYSIFEINRQGHHVVCLLSILPDKADSLLFHFPNISLSAMLAEAIDLPIRSFQSTGVSLDDETSILENALAKVMEEFNIQGIVHGGLCSNFQKKNFEKVCQRLGLSVFSPLWHIDPSTYLHKMIDDEFKIVIVAVSALGLGREWLGKSLNHENVKELESLSARYGFNLNFEGGEAETMVVDCPLYKKIFQIRKGLVKWFGDNGIFEITDYQLIDK